MLPEFLHVYATRHAQVALNSLGRLMREPLASLMTISVIAIALALPAALYLLANNLQVLSTYWDGDTTISLFLKQQTSTEQTQNLAGQFKQWSEIDAIQVITPQQALEEFRSRSGFGDALDLLNENPLPAVIALKPAPQYTDPDQISRLLDKLKALPDVEMAQLDLQWVKRLSAILALAKRGIWLVAGLLGLAVLLVVGNTIRLEIQNRKQEIEITRLIGATNGFIRRPFLYSGFWYGLTGALLAWLLLQIAVLLLGGPVRQLAGLYDSSFRLQAFSLAEAVLLLMSGTALGLLGAWLAVSRHLGSLEPQ